MDFIIVRRVILKDCPLRLARIGLDLCCVSKFLTISSEIISVIFHPLLMLTYALVFLMGANPYLFGTPTMSGQAPLIILIFISSFVIPFVAIVFMKMLGMVTSLSIPGREERIGPYIMVGTFYLWLFFNVKNQGSIPTAYAVCVLGTLIGLFTGFFINLFEKISIHGIGVGAMVVYAIIVRMRYSYGDFNIDIPGMLSVSTKLNYLLPFFFIAAGAVLSARLYLGAHNNRQVYMGAMVGAMSMVIALRLLQ